MKKLFLSIFALVLFAGFISCEKDPVGPNPGPDPVEKTITVNVTFGPIPEGITVGSCPTFALTDEDYTGIVDISYVYPESKLVLSGVLAQKWLGKTVFVYYSAGTMYYDHQGGQSTTYRIEKLEKTNNVYIPIQTDFGEFYLP